MAEIEGIRTILPNGVESQTVVDMCKIANVATEPNPLEVELLISRTGGPTQVQTFALSKSVGGTRT